VVIKQRGSENHQTADVCGGVVVSLTVMYVQTRARSGAGLALRSEVPAGLLDLGATHLALAVVVGETLRVCRVVVYLQPSGVVELLAALLATKHGQRAGRRRDKL